MAKQTGQGSGAGLWGEIAPGEHIVHIYDEDSAVLDSVESFVVGGLEAGEGVLVIATASRLYALECRIEANGFDLAALRTTDQYIGLEAHDTLATFMRGRWPDEEKLKRSVADLLARARGAGRRIRAFGEMVAVLWENGNAAAAIRLELVWKKLSQEQRFPLFCAYPRRSFSPNEPASLQEVCALHTQVI